MRQYVVDAFTSEVFGGNPAAICVLDRWLPDALMQQVARENRLSETAFAVREVAGAGAGVAAGGDADAGADAVRAPRWRLRWFTPGGEIDLCGHATLACAYVLLRFYEPDAGRVEFDTLGGPLAVERRGELLELDFPAYELRRVPVTHAMAEAVDCEPVAAYLGRDLLLVLPDEAAVRGLAPEAQRIEALEGLLCHVTARARANSGFDCVSRSFGPKLGIAEDPVCGSGHCHIVPYWAHELGKRELVAYQASERGGTLWCRMDGARVHLAGAAALYSQAEVFVP